VGTVWRVDPKDNLLRCVEIWHRPGVEVAAFEELTRRRTFSPGVGMPGRVWAGEEPVWVPDVTADANFPRRQVAAQCGLHGAVGFPVRDGQVQGVLEFYSREMRQPDDELIQMMTSIGSEITQFIERRQAQGELQRQAEDRRIARQIQQGLLPKTMPTLAGFRISGRSLSANEVGGDCFDFLPFSVEGQERLGVLLADASGHGVAAALLVAQTRAYLRALAMTYAGVDDLLTLTNRRLTSDLVADHFVSLFLAQLDPRTRSLVYANAGHCPGYVLDRQGEIKTVLAGTGGLVGIDQASEFSAGPTIKLEPGDLVFLYTDGIVEAMSRDGRLFGLERTLDLVRGHRHKTPDEIVDKLFDAVSAFSEGNIQDDLTAVILKAEGAG
jgi:serine phosphatase RsbU (regulator of sigma subunit)